MVSARSLLLAHNRALIKEKHGHEAAVDEPHSEQINF